MKQYELLTTTRPYGSIINKNFNEDLVDEKLHNEMMDKVAWHLTTCLWNKDEASSASHSSVS